ncbi:MAG: AAA family ATPase [Nitrospirae bacterium]|jgi:predicted ATPase|nr:AAA family ATPase [Nitrospirota bacterium]
MIKDFKRISASNFKSFRNLQLDLTPLTVLVGPNGSGKSNILELVKFLYGCLKPASFPHYPFSTWWGYKNIVFGKKEDDPVHFGLTFSSDRWEADYKATISGYGGELRFEEEHLSMSDIFQINRTPAQGEIIFSRNILRQAQSAFDSPDLAKGLPFVPPRQQFEIPGGQSFVSAFSSYSCRFEPTSGLFHGEIRLPEHLSPPFQPSQNGPRIAFVSPEITDPSLTVQPAQEAVRRPVFPSFLIDLQKTPVLVRQLDYPSMRNPSPYGNEGLEHGRGLVGTLSRMVLSSRDLPIRIDLAMKEFFPGWSLRFVPLPDGRIMMTVHDEAANIDLEPPSIPDGLYKMLTILVALESRPDILLIDEIENSLHVRLIEHLLDAIRSSETTTILTTHSPSVIDLVGLEELVLVEKSGGESIAQRVADPTAVRNRLASGGVTPSESWLYGNLR